MSALPIDVFIGVGPLMAITHSEFVKTGKAVVQCLYFGRSRKDTDRAMQGRRHNRCEGLKGNGDGKSFRNK